MPTALRLALITVFFGLTLAACGRTVQEDAPDSVADAVDEEALDAQDDEDVEVEPEFAYLRDLVIAFRRCRDQACLDAAVTQARADGYSDHDVASAMGVTYLYSPGRRILISVVYVRFKHESAVPPGELDAAYEYASTPPRLREQEAEEANAAEAPAEDESSDEDASSDDEDADDEEEAPRRRRGWFSWIPGL